MRIELPCFLVGVLIFLVCAGVIHWVTPVILILILLKMSIWRAIPRDGVSSFQGEGVGELQGCGLINRPVLTHDVQIRKNHWFLVDYAILPPTAININAFFGLAVIVWLGIQRISWFFRRTFHSSVYNWLEKEVFFIISPGSLQLLLPPLQINLLFHVERRIHRGVTLSVSFRQNLRHFVDFGREGALPLDFFVDLAEYLLHLHLLFLFQSFIPAVKIVDVRVQVVWKS